jgi:hypothetical protein
VLGCFNKIVVRLEQLAVYRYVMGGKWRWKVMMLSAKLLIPLSKKRLCSNDPKRPTTMGPLFDKPVVENTIPFG